MLKWMEQLFASWGKLLVERRGAVLWASIILGLVSLPLAIHTLRHLDANLLNQVSDRLPRFKALKEVTTDFGGDTLVTMLSIPEDQTHLPEKVSELKAFADLLTAELAKTGLEPDDQAALQELLGVNPTDKPAPWLRQVECRLGSGLRAELTTLAHENPQLVFGPEEIAEIERRFDPAVLQTRMKEIRDEWSGLDPNGLEVVKLKRDPLKISELIKDRIQKQLQLQGQSPVAGGDDYLLSADQTTLLVLSRPARSSNNVTYNRILMAACQRAENRAILAYRARNTPGLLSTSLRSSTYGQYARRESKTPDLAIGFTGLHALSVENERSLRKDILEGTVFAFMALIVIFLVAYRSLRLTLNISLTLFLAAIVTVASAGVLNGHIGILGAGFTSILIGTGVDYGIMIYGTFRKLQEQHGLDNRTAVAQTVQQRGSGILIACFTSVIGFLSLTIVDFHAIAEFGLLSGIGLAASALFMFLFFPLLLAPKKEQRGVPTRKITPLGLHTLGRMLSTVLGRRLGLGLGLVIAAACVGLLIFQDPPEPGMERFLGVRFDPDIGNMRNRQAPASLLRDKMVEKFGGAYADLRVIVEAQDELTALKTSEEVRRRAVPFMQQGDLRPGGSLIEFVPSMVRQEEVLRILKAVNLEAKIQVFQDAAKAEFGAKALEAFAPFTQSLQEFSETIRKAEKVTLAQFLGGPLGPLLSPYAQIDSAPGGAGSRVRLVSYFFPKKDADYTESWLNELAQSLEAQPPAGSTIRLTAARFVGFELKRSVIHDMEWIFFGVAVIIAIIVLYPLRSLKRAGLSIIPLCFSFLFVLAGVAFAERMGWELSLNYISMMVFPILLGSAVDYGIYMVLDLYSGRFPSPAEVLEETGHSLLLCCMTTLGGYGSMIVGSNSGMIYFGWVAILGYAGALFAALVVLPAIYGGLGGLKK